MKKNNKKERNFSPRFTGRIGNNKKENKIQEISDESACSDDREINNNNLIKKIRHREIRHREIRHREKGQIAEIKQGAFKHILCELHLIKDISKRISRNSGLASKERVWSLLGETKKNQIWEWR